MIVLRHMRLMNFLSRFEHVFGVRGSVAVRRLANPVTLCDGHGVFFVAASGQIRMAANKPDSSTASTPPGPARAPSRPGLLPSLVWRVALNRKAVERRARDQAPTGAISVPDRLPSPPVSDRGGPG